LNSLGRESVRDRREGVGVVRSVGGIMRGISGFRTIRRVVRPRGGIERPVRPRRGIERPVRPRRGIERLIWLSI